VSADFILTQVLNGISLGGLLFLLASGLTLIFGLMRIVNLAHGGFYLVGGYVGLTVTVATGNFWLAILAATAAIAVMGVGTERLLLRRIRGQVMPEVLLTVGLATILGDMSLSIWGGDPQSVPTPSYLSGSVHLGSLVYPRFRIFVTALAVVVGLGLYFLQQRTRIGAILRAGVDDRETIAALGINIQRVFTGVFILGALLAGAAGVIGGAFLSLAPGADIDILLLSLVVVIIGGLGSLPGAALGSLIVGLINVFGTSELPQLASFILFAPMALVLIIRPAGLLGRDS
jgi:branched-chain amino acid transport system permease protein